MATVVFRQYMEAFRTESVEHDRSQELKIGASAKGYGDAAVHRAKQDLERTKYSGAAASDSEVVIAECRRQEQAEREGQVEKAWAVTQAAEAEARAAKEETAGAVRDLATARAEVEALAKKQQESAAEIEAMKAALDSAETERTLELGKHRLAHERLALACEAGDAAACGSWGLLFEHGLGVAADPERAMELYERGCELADPNACASLVALARSDPRGEPSQ